jgi:Transglutaminase-like superfamily
MVFAVWAAALTAAAEPARPDFNRVDYSHPERYLDLPPTLVKPGAITLLVAPWIGTDEVKLRYIHRWMTGHLRDKHELPYRWRTVDQIIADQTTNANCADNALVFGALARAAHIPAVWVKTMDIDWIREFVRDPDHPRSWRGHVFLELFLDGKWRLLDAASFTLYDEYNTNTHILPGARWAYDKGGDPFTLLLSAHGAVWNEQTAAYFRGFDLAQLPVGDGRSLDRTVSIVADSVIGAKIAERARQLSLRTVAIFTAHYEKWLAAARGNWLVVAAIGNGIFLPEPYRSEYLALSPEQLANTLRAHGSGGRGGSGTLRHALADGTMVVLIYGTTAADLQKEIDRLSFDDP